MRGGEGALRSESRAYNEVVCSHHCRLLREVSLDVRESLHRISLLASKLT